MSAACPLVKGRPRPALFRALGKDEPPLCVTIAGRDYQRQEIYKHDSWAATALYQSGTHKVVCKFNRKQSILGLPMAWLGRWLARREAGFYARLADLPSVPKPCGSIAVDGVVLPNAVGHDYVEGRPLKETDRFPPAFFDALEGQLAQVHERGIAYMDLHKRENIILGADGRAYLVDFQVSFGASPRSWFLPARWLLRLFQNGDRYHLLKHRVRLGLHSSAERDRMLDEARPLWIRLHRFFAQPLRALRRRLLVLIGVRKGDGRAQSEHFTEDGLRANASESRAA
jgi:hypothetical protein